MAFLKPQHPIKKGENFVYPLTTVDQVILDDNSRLNSKMVTVDLNIENDEVSELPTRDADTLGGVPANQYALKENIPSLEPYALRSDTAPDSDSLGGIPADKYALKDDLEAIDNPIITLAQAEFDALSQTDIANYHANGVKTILVKSTNELETAASAPPIGSILCFGRGIDPTTIYGGTWELIDKQFEEKVYASDTNAFTYDTTNCDTGYISCVRNGHSIHGLIHIKNSVALTTTNILLGKVNYAELGITGMDRTQYVIGTGDGLNGFACAQLAATSGEFTHLHGAKNYTSGIDSAYIYYPFTIVCFMEKMLDSACDKFIWKRTA